MLQFFHPAEVALFFSLFPILLFLFFFNDTATTEIYTLSLHDALPIYNRVEDAQEDARQDRCRSWQRDRKSTRLNSSHPSISYAVFCLKKKKQNFDSLHLININITQTNTKISIIST